MAKQNVTFLERQLEKIVAGTAGAVLLFVLVSNLLLSPHTVDVSGETVGPGPFYIEMADKAERARERMRAASPGSQADAGQPDQLDPLFKQLGKAPPLEIAVAPVPLGPALEEIKGVPMPASYGGKVTLATVLPPTSLELSVGKAAARLPVPQVERIGVSNEASTVREELSPTSDLHWVTGAAVFGRKAQRDLFVAANYMPERQDVIVAEVRVERRAQEPNGVWSDPVVVQPYMRDRVVTKSEVGLIKSGDDYALMPGEDDYILKLRQALASRDVQEKVLRPDFQSFLQDQDPQEDDRYEWVIPETLKAADGTEIDMTDPDFKIDFMQEPDKTLRPRGLAGGGANVGSRTPGQPPMGDAPGTPPQGAKALIWARDQVKKAKEAIEKKNWVEAQQLLESVEALNDLPEIHKKEARDLLLAYRSDFERAQLRENYLRGTSETEEGLGRDVEPFWFTDISVRCGETYQYRVSMVLVNQYAGIASLLNKPGDARKLLVQGEWTSWSKPVTVPRSKYLFVTSVAPDGGRIGAELCEWLSGRWQRAPVSLAMGDVAAASRGPFTLDYGAVLVSADPSRPYQRRSQFGRGETFRYANETTGAAVLVTATGDVEEHFIAADTDARGDLNRLIADEKKRREALKSPTGVTPEPTPSRRLREREAGGERFAPPPNERRGRGGRQ